MANSTQEILINKWLQELKENDLFNYYSYSNLISNDVSSELSTEDLLAIKSNQIIDNIKQSYSKWSNKNYLIVKLSSLIDFLDELKQNGATNPNSFEMKIDKQLFDDSIEYIKSNVKELIEIGEIGKKPRKPTKLSHKDKGDFRTIPQQTKLLMLCYLSEYGFFLKRPDNIRHVDYGIFLGLLSNEDLNNMSADLETYETIVKNRKFTVKDSDNRNRLEVIKKLFENIGQIDIVKQIEIDLK